MIEVEKQFVIDAAARERLIAAAEFVGEVKNHDTYYDTADFSLTTKDIWLRNRNGRFELKVGVNETRAQHEGKALRYEEIEDEAGIRDRLSLAGSGGLADDLRAAGYAPYGSWVVTRTKYKKGDFTVDFDSVDFGYEVVEIELLVEEGSDLAAASARIVNFAREHGLKMEPVRGKNSTYLLRNNKRHFDALVAAGIVPVWE
jgi:adenylate cyclase class IV